MNKLKLLLSTMTILFAVMATSTAAHAQATRTWISGVGDDVNPCSRTAPCKTFAGAISKTAAGGIIDVLDPGGFGTVTITKAITLDGGGFLAGVLASGVNGIVVQAGSSDVVRLVNLDIEGGGTGVNGVRFISGAELFIEHSNIFGFSQVGIDVEPSDGLAHKLTVSDTNIDNNTGGGIWLNPTGGATVRATIDHVRTSMGSFGIRAQDGAIAIIRSSVSNDNVNGGYEAISTSTAVTMNIDNSLTANNVGTASSAGVLSQGAAATVRLTNVSIFNDSVGLSAVSGGNILSFRNNYNAGSTTIGVATGTLSPQ